MNQFSGGRLLLVLAASAPMLACTVGKDGAPGAPGVPCNGCVTAASLAPGAVTAAAIQDGAVQTPQLGSKSVTGAIIADATVTGSNIASATIKGANIATGAITGAHLAAGAVGSTQLATGAVTSGTISPGAVSTTQIADAAVTTAKLALGGNLATGSTLRGFWAVTWTAAAANELHTTDIPFGFTLAVEPTGHFIASGATPPAGCPGTASNPQADPGHFCVYEHFTNNTQGKAVCSFNNCGAAPGNATRFGAWFEANSIGVGFAHARGTWALTAP